MESSNNESNLRIISLNQSSEINFNNETNRALESYSSYSLNNNQFSISNRIQSQNPNLIEILQNATDYSNEDDNFSNIENNDEYNLRDNSVLSQEASSISGEDMFESSGCFIKKLTRSLSAPTKSNNEVEEFKYSTQFIFLEKLVQLSSGLMMKSDGKFDVESDEGCDMFKIFLEKLELFIVDIKIKTENRDYRKKFSQAYLHLYKDGQLCYLTEILDSAQEGIPCLWVNSEKYYFSKEVLDSGMKLYETFCNLLVTLRTSYNIIKNEAFKENLLKIKKEIKEILEKFDLNWVNYEMKYISELIEIENKSRRFIVEAIEVEKELLYIEVRAKAKGKILIESEDYNKVRKRLISLICEMNKVANIEGKGRDDLNLNILITAEGVIRKISVNNSKSIRNIAGNVKETFMKFRELLEKYSENIETVDPQLKNNQELVDCLFNLETAWDKGKEFLLDKDNYERLMFFSQLIEILCEKYKELKELIESRDPSIFVSIPGVLILKSLEFEDEGICFNYNQNMKTIGKECNKLYEELKRDYDKLKQNIDYSPPNYSSESRKNSSNKIFSLSSSMNLLSITSKNETKQDLIYLYTLLEKFILFEDNFQSIFIEMNVSTLFDKLTLEKFISKIKTLSMNLQRERPSEWNAFFDMAMNTVSS